MPEVSVVIPTAGRPELVVRALRSVLAQTVTNIEVIVVIDGPDPATAAALAAVVDPRLRVVTNPERRHVGESRNVGVDHARAPWIGFLDDDDEWLPQRLEKQLALAGGRDAIVMALSRVVTPIAEYVWPRTIYDGRMPIDEYLFDRRSWLKGDGFVQTSSILMPRRLFDCVRFSPQRQHEDWELLIRAMKQHGFPLLTVPEPLVVHYAEADRGNLSQRFPWRASFEWLNGLGDLVTPRAYSGFCLSILAPQPARFGEFGAFWPLLSASVRRGAPTARQLAFFLVAWSTPMKLRQSIRRLVSRA